MSDTTGDDSSNVAGYQIQSKRLSQQIPIMLIDFLHTAETHFEADVCIIGAGAAGFASAVSLLNSGLKILVVEGGGTTVNAKAQQLHNGIVTAHPHSGINEARERVVGGTTTKWGGQALPFMKEDFEERAHIDLSGWPIGLADMQPYYKAAEDVLGTDGSVEFGYNPWKERAIEQPTFSVENIELFVTKWCKVPNFAIQHGAKLESSANVTLLVNANVVELLPTTTHNAVKALKILSLDKKEGMIKARFVIAAGGAIETCRLFLASKKFDEDGLGNSSGLVGCFFQDHVAAIVGQIIPTNRKKLHDVFDPFYKNGFKYLPRIKLMPSLAEKLHILHASAQIVFANDADNALDGAKQIFSLVRQKQVPGYKTLKPFLAPKKITQVGQALWRWKMGNRGTSAANGPVWLEVHSEQNPVKESRITLSNEVDELGMQRVNLNWVISESTKKTIREMAALVKDEFEQANVGKVFLEPWVCDKSFNADNWLTDVYHQAGGLRMADSEDEGVVDADCKVHGIDNLYVASSAVFPTSSFSNPTMTIIALAIRICDTIKQRAKSTNHQAAALQMQL